MGPAGSTATCWPPSAFRQVPAREFTYVARRRSSNRQRNPCWTSATTPASSEQNDLGQQEADMSVQKDREVSAPVDGNAIAGLLRELFAFEATTANITCGGCGVAARIGEVRVYGSPMGAIFGCAHCDTAVIRLVR